MLIMRIQIKQGIEKIINNSKYKKNSQNSSILGNLKTTTISIQSETEILSRGMNNTIDSRTEDVYKSPIRKQYE